MHTYDTQCWASCWPIAWTRAGYRCSVSYTYTFCGIDSELIPLFRGRKCSFRGYSEFHGRTHSEALNGTERNSAEKIVFRNRQKSSFLALFLKFAAAVFCCELHCYSVCEIQEGLLLFLFYGREFRAVSLLRNDSERNSTFCFNFSSTEQNPEHFSLLRNGSERNSGNFAFRGTARIPSE